jgi:hypothetical protein
VGVFKTEQRPFLDFDTVVARGFTTTTVPTTDSNESERGDLAASWRQPLLALRPQDDRRQNSGSICDDGLRGLFCRVAD